MKVGVFDASGSITADFTRQWTIDGLERPAVGALGSGFTMATLTSGPYAGTPRDVTFSLTIGRMDLATLARGYSIDDITLTAVPEPATTTTILLLASASLLATRRRWQAAAAR